MNINHRVVLSYALVAGFFGFLVYAYVNYEGENKVALQEIEALKGTNAREIKKQIGEEIEPRLVRLEKAMDSIAKKLQGNEAVAQSSDKQYSNIGIVPEQIETIAKKVIENNPQLIIDSVTKLQTQKMEAQEKDVDVKVANSVDKLVGNPNNPRVGLHAAPIKVVEFFDYNCSHCGQAAPVNAKIIENEKDVQLVFREFPVLGSDAIMACKAALAVYSVAGTQKYIAYQKILFDSAGQSKTEGVLAGMAEKLGVNLAKFTEALNSKKVADVLQDNIMLATSLGIHSVPTYVVNGQRVSRQALLQTIARVRAEIAANKGADSASTAASGERLSTNNNVRTATKASSVPVSPEKAAPPAS